ncbi:MAG: hypothetical protein AB7E55_30955 [Pigmentiphaga sp.]
MLSPYDFRPLSELQHEETVQFKLVSGNIVYGRMVIGVVTPASRTYYHTEHSVRHLLHPMQITGWRPLLDPDIVAEWRRHSEREAA